MRNFEFDLVLASSNHYSDELVESLFAAGIDDGTVMIRDSLLTIMFDRQADDLETAILSAIKDVKKAAPNLSVLRVEFCQPSIVSVAEIGKRIDKSREMVRLYVLGERGPGGFPPPVAPGMWDWSEVVQWLQQHQLFESPLTDKEIESTNAINSILAAQRHIKSEQDLVAMWEKVAS